MVVVNKAFGGPRLQALFSSERPNLVRVLKIMDSIKDANNERLSCQLARSLESPVTKFTSACIL